MKICYDGVEYWSVKELCEKLGINYYSVTSYKKDNNVSFGEAVTHFLTSTRVHGKPWTEEDDAEVRNLAEAGKSCEEIAEMVDRTVRAVRKYCYINGIKIHVRHSPTSRKTKNEETTEPSKKRRSWTKAEVIYLQEHRNDTNLKTLCDNLKRSKWVVLQKCKELGI